jgi:predicted acetyltransferase
MSDVQYYMPVLVEVIPALPEHEPVLANLLELYAHDFSEFMDLEIGPDGRFGYQHLPLYWKEEDRYPFLILGSGNLAGFAFVRKGSQLSGNLETWDMTEFFVLRGYRRLGVGTKAAHVIWKKLPGTWEIRVRERNRGAKAFWAGAVDTFTDKKIDPIAYEKEGELWHVFSFEAK